MSSKLGAQEPADAGGPPGRSRHASLPLSLRLRVTHPPSFQNDVVAQH
jgi:hypothetical protein